MKLLSFCIVSAFFLAANVAWAEVNINTASATELAQELKNVGPSKAAAIIEYRKMHGNFKSVDELVEVHGIGESTLEMNRAVITLEDSKSGDKPGAVRSNESNLADSKQLHQ